MTDPDAPVAPAPSDRRRSGGRLARLVEDARLPYPRTAVVSVLLLAVMVLGGTLMPVPYVIERPGPAIDVLGQYEDEDILTIDGADEHPTYDTDGALMMTTVSVDGGPGFAVTPAEVAVAWLSPSSSVLPREVMFPEGQTREQTTLSNTVQMSTSQQGAVALALDALDIDYEPVVMVAGVEEGSPADGVLEGGDVVREVDGQSAEGTEEYQSLAAGAGESGDVPMLVERDGDEVELEVPTRVVDGEPRMGVVLASGYDFPIDIEITVGSIGGPSAGMMFALAVYDQLTPESLTGGESIAGTGTVEADGEVGPIGGIRQKLVGAQETGAEFFLAPADNCDDVVGHAPDGLDVVAVSSFDEALDATTTIAESGSAAGLPTCEDIEES